MRFRLPGIDIDAAHQLGVRTKTYVVLLALKLGTVLTEGVGLSLLLPVFDIILNEASTATEKPAYWEYLEAFFAWFATKPTLGTLLCFGFVVICGRQAFIYCERIVRYRARESLIRDVRDRGFQGYLNATTEYQEGSMQGELMNDLTTEVERATVAAFEPVTLLGAAVMTVIYLIGLFALSPLMTLLSLGVIAVTVLALKGLMKKTSANSREITSANRRASIFLAERIRATRLIRLSSSEELEAIRMQSLNDRRYATAMTFNKITATIAALVEPMAVGIGFGLLYLGMTYFGLRIEIIGMFLVVVLRLMPVITEMTNTYQTLLGFQASLSTVARTIERLQEIRERRTGSAPMPALTSYLKFENVSYTYDGSPTPALSEINMVIPAGRMTAVVGPSGAGKSTLIDLLPRLREPTSGHIYIDDVDLKHIDNNALRRAIAYVQQIPEVFNVTVFEHLSYGRADASMAEVEQAARLAGAHEFIGVMKHGYDTQLGEDGTKMSGGQRQRLDLARALVAQASILILDEPTSNLDAASAKLFGKSLSRIRENTDCTIIVVAHNLSSIVGADFISVFEAGRIVQSGTHEELLQRSEWYANAYATQITGREPIVTGT